MSKHLPTLLILALLLPGAINALAADQEKMIDRRYDVAAGGTLEIDVGDSDVEVLTGNASEVLVEVYLDAEDMERGRDYFERQHFDVSQRGSIVRVESDPENRTFDWRVWRHHPRILTRVTVPERFHADLRTSDGDVYVERLTGEVYLRTSDGDVTADALSGERLSLKTSDGDIRIKVLDATAVDIETSDGDLQLDDITAARITARTSDGDVRAGRLIGETELKTSDGDIRVRAVEGNAFSARTSDGNITVDEIMAGSTYARTSDGDIRLDKVSGALEVSGTEGDIYVNLVKPDAVSLTTSDGDITIDAPSSLPADLRLRGEDVRVAASFNFQGRVDEEHAEGAINGGGPRLEARTSDGTVTLRSN